MRIARKWGGALFYIGMNSFIFFKTGNGQEGCGQRMGERVLRYLGTNSFRAFSLHKRKEAGRQEGRQFFAIHAEWSLSSGILCIH